MKVFIDTNVWVSAYASHGVCHELLLFVRQRHQAHVHELVLEEFSRVWKVKFRAPPAAVDGWVADIREVCVVHAAMPAPRQRTRDPKDDPILQAALDADAEWLVTGDADLTSLKRVKRMPITTPRDFLEALGVEEPWI